MALTYLIAEDVALRYRVSLRKLHELSRRDLLPCRVLPYGRRLLFEEEHLRAWEDGCELERVDLPGNGRIVRPKVASS